MQTTFRKRVSAQRWFVFISVAMCIAAGGISSYFFQKEKEERDKRIAAEDRLQALRDKLQLLEDENRELAEQLREAKRIAEELAGERERLMVARAEASPEVEPSPTEATLEESEPVSPEDVAGLRDAVAALRWERVALVAKQVRQSAGSAWRAVREAAIPKAGLAQVFRVTNPGETSEPKLTDVMEMFPSAEFSRMASVARDSAGKTLDSLRSLFSPVVETPTTSVSPPPPVGVEKLTATNEDLRKELEQVRQEKRELEKEIAVRTGEIPGAVNVGKVRITTGRRFSGKVLVVNPKYDFVVIDIGRNQGLEKGEVLIVHRGKKFIGKVEVIKVYEKMAAADLVTNWMQDDVHANDGVKKF